MLFTLARTVAHNDHGKLTFSRQTNKLKEREFAVKESEFTVTLVGHLSWWIAWFVCCYGA